MAEAHVAEQDAPAVGAIVLERSTLSIAVLAVALRLVWVALFARTPSGLSDPQIYHLAARSIADGEGYRSITGNVTSYYPPGYPYALGWWYRVADVVGLDDQLPIVVGVFQSLLWGVAVIAVIVTGQYVGGRMCGLAAGLVLATWPNLITYAGAVLSESLFVALFACAVAAFAVVLSAPGDRLSQAFVAPIVIAGGLIGLAAMVRPQVLIAVPAVAAAWWWAQVGTARVVALLAACAVGVAVLAGPWAVRNARQLGEPVFISTNSGDNLCLGYNPDANGGFGFYAPCDTGEFYIEGPEAELRRNKENRRNALNYIADEPGSIPLLAAKKLWITFESDDDGLRANESYGEDVFMSAGWRMAWQVLAHVAYVVIMVAAAWGTLLAVRRLRGGARGDLPMLLTLLVLGAAGLAVPMAVFGDPRFKVPSTPVLAVLAGLAIAQLATAVAARTSIASDDGGAVEVSG